jgi:hypothetical protein
MPISENGYSRVVAMNAARSVAQRLVSHGDVSNLATAIIDRSLTAHGRLVAGIWANCTFRGMNAAILAARDGRPYRKPAMSVQVVLDDDVLWFDGELEIEHVYSSSCAGYMSGKNQAYVLGLFDRTEGAQRGTVRPWLVGDLVHTVGVEGHLGFSWGHTSEVHPMVIDAFKAMVDVRPPSQGTLKRIMLSVSEAQTKAAIAAIIGESFVPRDWGGERSDLFTSQITIEKEPITAAFLLKGPAVPGPMHPRHLGRNGDQIVRLFDEPADLLILQHCNKIETTVRKIMRAFSVDPDRPRRFCVIDGAQTYQILKAYGFLDSSNTFVMPKGTRRRVRRSVKA